MSQDLTKNPPRLDPYIEQPATIADVVKDALARASRSDDLTNCPFCGESDAETKRRLPGPSDLRCPRCGTMTSAIHGCPCVNPTPTGSEQ